ncbi:MAG: PPC domain-containing protein [Nocardioides sp.]
MRRPKIARNFVGRGIAVLLVAAVAPGQLTPATSLPNSAPADLAGLAPRIGDGPGAPFVDYASGKPVGPNPYLAFLPPGVVGDYVGWAKEGRRLSAERAASAEHREARAIRSSARTPLASADREPIGRRGLNDTRATAQPLSGFGTNAPANPKAAIRGTLSPEPFPASKLVSIPPNLEDDSSFAKARDTGVGDRRPGIRTTGVIGDGPDNFDGFADYYQMNLRGGEFLRVTMTRRSGNLKPFLVLYEKGNPEQIYDSFDDLATGEESEVTVNVRVPRAGTYYVVASGVVDFVPPDDFVSTKGRYDLTISAGAEDRDLWALDLRAGDVLATRIRMTGTDGRFSVSGPAGTESHSPTIDGSFLYPAASPLPSGTDTNPVSDYVVPRNGRYYVEVSGGDGAYSGTLEVYRYAGEKATAQTIFLDTDGARVNTNIWGEGNRQVTLSPLAKFLGDWGLRPDQERALVSAVKANVEENLQRDLVASGLSDTVRIKVASSLDGPDLTGKPGVTRIILGGTIAESGIDTIGIAQSIDPGNFARAETGLVLLDLMSAPGSPTRNPASLNSYLGKGSNRLSFVAEGLGNVASHEVGHMVGNWHTDNSNTTANLMDSGGFNDDQFYGVGPDRLGGTADDRDVDFVPDTYNESYLGRGDSRARSVWGLSIK